MGFLQPSCFKQRKVIKTWFAYKHVYLIHILFFFWDFWPFNILSSFQRVKGVFTKPPFPFSFNKTIHIWVVFRFPSSYDIVMHVHVHMYICVQDITFYFRGSLPLLPPQVSMSLLSPSPLGSYFRNNHHCCSLFLPFIQGLLLFSHFPWASSICAWISSWSRLQKEEAPQTMQQIIISVLTPQCQEY